MWITSAKITPVAVPDVPLVNPEGVHQEVFLRAIIELQTDMCDAAGLGVAMHSNSHLGISLAAMRHVAAATPNLTFDCDTHYPWYTEDIIQGGRLEISSGALTVPEGPGLGVSLDQDALARLHSLYKEARVKDRDDTDEMQKYVPGYVRKVPRW